MRILVLSQFYAPEIGATQTRLLESVAAMKRAGHEVTVLTAMPNHLQGEIHPDYRGRLFMEEEIDGVRVLRTWLYAAQGRGMKRLANYLSFTVAAALAGPKTPPVDLVFFESLPLFIGATAAAIATAKGAKLVMNVPDLWPDSLKAVAPDSLFAKAPFFPAALKLEAWLYRRADLITAVTPGIHHALIHDKGVSPERVALLPNGINPERFAARPYDQAQTEPRVFLAIGSHGYAHGLEVILEAAALLAHRKDIAFRLVGDGSTKAELMDKARAMKLSNLEFAPPVALDEVPEELARCSASLVTLRDDPFYDRTRPARTLPSMACARPIIFSGRGDVAELIAANNCGDSVPPGDAAALARAVERCADEPERAAALGQAGADYAHRHCTWDALLAQGLGRLA